jgi:hypothetical protein
MSLHKTKPRWHNGEIIATERGWVNPQNNEVLVSIGNLKTKLEAEDAKNLSLKIDTAIEVIEVVKIEVEVPDEVETEEVDTQINSEVKTTRKYVRKSVEPKKENIMEEAKKEIIGEVVESIVDSKKIIGEVVETDLEKQIIAE